MCLEKHTELWLLLTKIISLPLQGSLLGLLVTYKARRTKPGRLLSREEFRDSGHQTSGSSVAACPVCDSVPKVTFDVLVLLCNAPLCSLSSTSKCLPRTALRCSPTHSDLPILNLQRVENPEISSHPFTFNLIPVP